MGGGLDLAVEREERRIGQALDEAFAHPLDLAHAGKEREQVARLLAPCRQHRGGHSVFDPLIR